MSQNNMLRLVAKLTFSQVMWRKLPWQPNNFVKMSLTPTDTTCIHCTSARQEALLWQRDRAMRLSVEILQLNSALAKVAWTSRSVCWFTVVCTVWRRCTCRTTSSALRTRTVVVSSRHRHHFWLSDEQDSVPSATVPSQWSAVASGTLFPADSYWHLPPVLTPYSRTVV